MTTSGHYPFLVEGLKTTFEVKVTTEGLYARVDMPGVGTTSELQIFTEKSTVVFMGEARAEARFMYEQPRKYMGKFELLSVPDFTCKVIAQLTNGVLRFFVPAVLSDFYVARPFIFVTLPLPPLPSSENEGKRERHPFQVGGLNSSVIKSRDKLFVRADLSGAEVVLFTIDKTGVNFICEALREWEFEEKPRRMYSGRFSLNCECCTIRHVESNFVSGFLTFLISKVTKNSDPNAKCDLIVTNQVFNKV